jgi:glucose/arabinose dehydrogenase
MRARPGAALAVAASQMAGPAIALVVAAMFAVALARGPAAASMADRIELPEGFSAEVWADAEGARTLLVVDELDAVLIGTRGDRIYAAVDADGDFRAERVETVFTGLHVANGLAWSDGHLYVALQDRIVRYAAPDLESLKRAEPEVIFDGLPDDSHHGWRYAGFGPDGMLYVAVGAPCNICAVDGLEGTIVRLDVRGGPGAAAEPEVFASGVRNSVGFDWQPGSGEMYFTDNGADWMGDDSPPDELNRARRPGLFFGFPYYGGGHDRTREFVRRQPPQPVTFPVVPFGAHVAALGMEFYDGRMFPEAYRGDAFVAQHGSWNRTVPDGYRVVRVRFDEAGRARGYETFAAGFLRGGEAWGRPVDVAVLGDGSLLVSDDRAGAIYRITYRAP